MMKALGFPAPMDLRSGDMVEHEGSKYVSGEEVAAGTMLGVLPNGRIGAYKEPKKYTGALNGMNEIQDEIWEWRQRQPWKDERPTATALGVSEEVGELSRAVLKHEQGIRGTADEWEAEIAKELGDVFIKLCDVASVFGLSLQRCIEERWAIVSERNFTKDRIGHGIDKS